MRVLFFSNAMPTFFSAVRSGPSYVTGGWITGMLSSLAGNTEIAAACCFPIPKEELAFESEVMGVRCFGVPMEAAFALTADAAAQTEFSAVLNRFGPDVVHIWGTESAAALPLLYACREKGILKRAVIHMQGVCRAIARDYEAGLPENIVNGWTLRDFLRRDNIASAKRAYARRAENEAEMLGLVSHVIGRTDFDRAEVLAVNPSLIYHHCNESLRPGFYAHKWQRETAAKHALFFSQGNYPLKGLHVLIEALPKLAARYPDLTLHVAGGDPTRRHEGLKGALLISSYGAYLKKLLAKNDLDGRVAFLGTLGEEGMLSEYLAAGAFVSASANENSPNSVSEAMLLGVPLVSTNVGGVPSIVSEDDARLVPFGSADALYEAIAALFDNADETDRLRQNARAHAKKTHDRAANRKRLLSIFSEIANG